MPQNQTDHHLRMISIDCHRRQTRVDQDISANEAVQWKGMEDRQNDRRHQIELQ